LSDIYDDKISLFLTGDGNHHILNEVLVGAFVKSELLGVLKDQVPFCPGPCPIKKIPA